MFNFRSSTAASPLSPRHVYGEIVYIPESLHPMFVPANNHLPSIVLDKTIQGIIGNGIHTLTIQDDKPHRIEPLY